MSNLYPVAGCRIFIGGVLNPGVVDLTEADFEGQVWTEIDGYETMGPFGDAGNLITTPLINRGRDTKQKGTANAGQMANNFAVLDDDPGQIALLAAADASNKNNYAIKVELNDRPLSGSDPQPSKRYFAALVMGAQEAGGQANTARLLSSTFEINSNVVAVPRSTGDAPSNTVLPAITGTAQEGETLSASTGTWIGATSYAYQWQEDTAGNETFANISGATSATYLVDTDNVGNKIRVVVTATNAIGSTPANSAPTEVVIAA